MIVLHIMIRRGITEEEDAPKIDGDNNPRDLILRNETPQPEGREKILKITVQSMR